MGKGRARGSEEGGGGGRKDQGANHRGLKKEQPRTNHRRRNESPEKRHTHPQTMAAPARDEVNKRRKNKGTTPRDQATTKENGGKQGQSSHDQANKLRKKQGSASTAIKQQRRKTATNKYNPRPGSGLQRSLHNAIGNTTTDTRLRLPSAGSKQSLNHEQKR